MEYMVQNNVQGFAKEAARTLERKVQGDLSLAHETVQAHLNPTEGQKLLQAGSSAVAKVAQSPAANGFWGMGAAAGPVAANDATAMFKYLQEKDDKFFKYLVERDEKQQENNDKLFKYLVQALPAPPPQAPQAEQPPPPAPKRQAEQAPAPERHRQKLRAAYVPQPQGPSAAAEAPGPVHARRGAGRPKGSFTVLKLDSVQHRPIFTWLKDILPRFVSEVPEARKKENQTLYLTDLQEALLAIQQFKRMVEGRKLAVESLKRAMLLAFPMSGVGERKAYHRRIGPEDEKGGRHGFHHYELNYDKLENLIQQMP